MAAVTAYVRSPFSTTGMLVRGDDNYCDGSGTHPVCNPGAGWVLPTDISGVGTLTLRVNYPNVRRIRTFVGLQCCSDTSPTNLRRVVIVELYGVTTVPDPACRYAYIGSILYGHVASVSVGDNQWYDLTSGEKVLGTVATETASRCSTGGHSHMQIMPGGTRLVTCSSTISSSTSIYKWIWYNNVPC